MTKRELLMKAIELGADISTTIESTNWLSLNLGQLRDEDDEPELSNMILYDVVESEPNEDAILEYYIDVQDGKDHPEWEDLTEKELYKALPEVIKYLENK